MPSPLLPKPKEGEIQAAILQYLSLKRYTFFRNNTGAMKLDGRFIRFGSVGWPDIIGILPTGKFFGIEVKRHDGKPTDAQVAVGDRIVASNGLYCIARSLDDVIKAGL